MTVQCIHPRPGCSSDFETSVKKIKNSQAWRWCSDDRGEVLSLNLHHVPLCVVPINKHFLCRCGPGPTTKPVYQMGGSQCAQVNQAGSSCLPFPSSGVPVEHQYTPQLSLLGAWLTGEDPVVRSEVGWEESPRGYGGLVLAVKIVQTQLSWNAIPSWSYSLMPLYKESPSCLPSSSFLSSQLNCPSSTGDRNLEEGQDGLCSPWVASPLSAEPDISLVLIKRATLLFKTNRNFKQILFPSLTGSDWNKVKLTSIWNNEGSERA